MENNGLLIMALIYIAAGVYHFVNPGIYKAMMPPYIPWPKTMVIISGAAEIILGAGLLYRPTQIISAWGLIVLLVAVFPANVYMATSDKFKKIPAWIRYLRLPLQAVLIWWAFTFTHPVL